jgi:hypothetical protein
VKRFPYLVDTQTESEWRSEEAYLARPVPSATGSYEDACVVCGRPAQFETCPRCDDDIERDRRAAS